MIYISGPQPFWYQGPVSGSQFFRGHGVGRWRGWGMVQAVMQATGSDGEWQMKLVACLPLTSAVQPGPQGWGPLIRIIPFFF